MQIFFTLVASIGLRTTPPDPTLSALMNALLLIVPIVGLVEPIYGEKDDLIACAKRLIGGAEYVAKVRAKPSDTQAGAPAAAAASDDLSA